jgi:glycosyltransferase involved in cell wall biosynthesis
MSTSFSPNEDATGTDETCRLVVRILIVNNFARITGGADLHCLQLAGGLRARGHEVAFLATADPLNQEDRGQFVPLIVTNATRDQVSGRAALGVAASAFWNTEAARAARSLIVRFRPHVAHLHKLYVQLSVAPVVVAARSGVPIVQTVHDYEFIAASGTDATGGWTDRVEPRAQHRALNTLLYGVKRLVHRPRVSSWIAVSRSTAQIYAASGIDATVIPNFTMMPPRQTPLARFADRRGVLYVGRLSREKGIADVLHLASQAPDLPIVIAGQGPLQSLVIKAAKLRPNLEFAGSLSPAEVGARLSAARLVVMPSLWKEPGPLAALEAMAHGVPIIAYENGGLAEYVTDAGAGVVISPSAETLARTTTELYRDAARWGQLAQRGPEAVRTTHAVDTYIDRLELIYLRAGRRSRRDRNR